MSNRTSLSESIKQQLLTKLCEQLDDGIFILDANLCYLSVNPAYELIIGYQEKFLLGRSLGVYDTKFLSDDERALLIDISSTLNKHETYKKEFSLLTRFGQTFDCQLSYRKVTLNHDIYYLGMVRDISLITQEKKQIIHLLNFDPLTGLPNRKVFLSQTNELMMNYQQALVMVRFNIDGYRNLASTLTADELDRLITHFVARVNALSLQDLQCFSHFGGDDFALIFQSSDTDRIQSQLDKLIQICEQPFLIANMKSSFAALDDHKSKKVYLHFSIGVSCFPKNDKQLLGLLTKAEKALHYAKNHSGDTICWYHNRLDHVTTADLKLEAELRSALQQGQFIPYYQPKIALATGEIVGFEALVRWQHPTRGLLRPNDFMETIIKHKLSFELFCLMAKQIVAHLCQWQNLGYSQYICINADAIEFKNPNFYNFVSHLFTENAIAPQQMHIEITESSLMLHHEDVKQQLLSIKALGINLALDDFGTGYASLSYLQQYPFDFIKIDKSFISDLVTNTTQQAIVKTILDLASALKMSTVAEGIETRQQRDVLLNMGCAFGQGYWFSRPINIVEATAMLVDHAVFH